MKIHKLHFKSILSNAVSSNTVTVSVVPELKSFQVLKAKAVCLYRRSKRLIKIGKDLGKFELKYNGKTIHKFSERKKSLFRNIEGPPIYELLNSDPIVFTVFCCGAKNRSYEVIVLIGFSCDDWL